MINYFEVRNDSLYFLFVDYEPKIVETGYPHNMSADSLISSNEKILDLLNESTTSREKGHEMIELRLQNEAKKLAFKEIKEENKILLKNLASIDDVNIHEYIRSEQERIIRKMRQEQQQQSSSVTQNLLNNILEILEVPEQIYQTISVVIIFKFE